MKEPSVDFAIAQTSSKPCLSAEAFAQPLFATNPLAFPSFLSDAYWRTRAGATLNAFRVNEAAAEVGRSDVDSDGKLQGRYFFDTAVYASQRISFWEQLVREWALEVEGLEWYVSGLLDEEDSHSQMIGSVRGTRHCF